MHFRAARMRTGPKTRLLLVAFAALLGAIAVYSPLVSSPHFADDLLFVLPDKPVNPLELLSDPSPTGHYRPLETMVHAWSQHFFGLNPVPVHLATLGIHAMVAALCGALALVATRRTVIGVAASLYMAAAQTNVVAAGSLDTLSQVLSTLFGYLSLLLVAVSLRTGGITLGPGTLQLSLTLAGAVLSLALALLSKETGFGFAIAVCAALLFAIWHRRAAGARSTLPLAACLVAIIVLAAVYLAVRAQVASFQPGIGQERWSFNLGWNGPVNLASLAFLAALPISSVSVYDAARNGGIVLVSAGAVLALAVAFAAAAGLHARLGARVVAAIIVCGAAVVLPVIVLHNISEHYAYVLTPLVAVGLALAVWKFMPGQRGAKAFVPLLFAVALALNATATYQRAAHINATARSADEMLAELGAAVKPAAQGARIILIDRRSGEFEYSVYNPSGFELISSADGYVPPRQVAYLIGRPDLDIILVVEGELSKVTVLPGDLRLTVDASGRIRTFGGF